MIERVRSAKLVDTDEMRQIIAGALSTWIRSRCSPDFSGGPISPYESRLTLEPMQLSVIRVATRRTPAAR